MDKLPKNVFGDRAHDGETRNLKKGGIYKSINRSSRTIMIITETRNIIKAEKKNMRLCTEGKYGIRRKRIRNKTGKKGYGGKATQRKG